MMQPTSFMLLPVIYDNAAGRRARDRANGIITDAISCSLSVRRVRLGRLKIAATSRSAAA